MSPFKTCKPDTWTTSLKRFFTVTQWSGQASGPLRHSKVSGLNDPWRNALLQSLTNASEQAFNKYLLMCKWMHEYLYFTFGKRKLAVIQFNDSLQPGEHWMLKGIGEESWVRDMVDDCSNLFVLTFYLLQGCQTWYTSHSKGFCSTLSNYQ